MIDHELIELIRQIKEKNGYTLNDLSKKIGHSRIRYTQLYLMYILLFLIFLLLWKLK